MKHCLAGLIFVALSAAAEPLVVATQPRASVRFKVVGPIDDVAGSTRAVAGQLELDFENIQAARGTVSVNLTTLRTGIDARDQDMQVEFLDTPRFPDAVLTIDALERLTDARLRTSSSVSGDVVGSFQLHGVRRAVKVPVTIQRADAAAVTVTGSFPVAFADYGIPRPRRLFLKLGEVATVEFQAHFVRKEVAPVAVLPVQATVAEVLPPALPPKPPPARKPKRALLAVPLFSGDDAKAKGERLFHSSDLGGVGNKFTCGHCHLKSDERKGLTAQDGFARPAHSLYNSAQRPRFWNGFATNVGDAANICQKYFMKGEGLSSQQRKELTQFLKAISPDPAPELDYRTLYRTYESTLANMQGGDAARGKALADKYCMTCHLDGRVGPTWAPGLYEPDWVVQRVRRLEGHANKRMPPFSMERLPDSDLRDIVSYLTSPASAPPIFNRSERKRAD